MVFANTVRTQAVCLFLALLAEPSVARADALALLPDGTDVIVSVNFRRCLDDHRNTSVVQNYLQMWRLAQQADEKALRSFFQDCDALYRDGLTEEQFLDQARNMRAVNDSMGMDVLQNLDRAILAFRMSDAGSPVILLEGRFEQARVEKFRGLVARWTGPVEVEQVNGKVLAITGSKASMDDIRGRAARMEQGALSAPARALVDAVVKEQFAFVIFPTDATVKAALKLLDEGILQQLGAIDEKAQPTVLKQFAARLAGPDNDCVAAALGLSVGAEELRLHMALQMKKPETAQLLRIAITQGANATALALQIGGIKLNRMLADVLQHMQVLGTDTLVHVRGQVPHETSGAVLLAGWKTLQKSGDALQRRFSSVRLWRPPGPQPGAFDVDEVSDLAYRDDPRADPIRHRLDLFLPRGQKNFPVVMLVHGGAWVMGDNRCCGLYSSVAYFLASQGFGVVLPNYRLSPSVQHPAHIQDVASAVAWTHRHIGERGGDRRRFYLMGHSAGGHLVSLLATDESYLKTEGLSTAAIRGVMVASGVYHIPPGAPAAVLGGRGPNGLGAQQMFPMRGDSALTLTGGLPGIPLNVDLFRVAFGDNPKERTAASPANHVRPNLPPFLILTAANDLPTLTDSADQFYKALERAGGKVQRRTLERRNHNSLLFSAIQSDDPAAQAMVQFLREREKGH